MIDPIILFFLLGATAGLLRSELRLPAAVYELVSIVLLLSIGLKGGIELSKQPLAELAPQVLATMGLGFQRVQFTSDLLSLGVARLGRLIRLLVRSGGGRCGALLELGELTLE